MLVLTRRIGEEIVLPGVQVRFTLLAVGPGRRNDQGAFVPLIVQPGDTVLFGKYRGQTVKLDGEELLVIREEDVLAIVEA